MHYQYPNHLLHFILSLLTVGLWLPVWFVIAVGASSHNRSVDRRIALATLVAHSTVIDEDGNPVAMMIDDSGELHTLSPIDEESPPS